MSDTQPPDIITTAMVTEFRILWTAQKLQKLKRWQDGFLRYHARNKRIIVYDDTRSVVCDMYLQQGNEIHEGDELEFENHLVSVEEYCKSFSQNISQLLPRSTPAFEKIHEFPCGQGKRSTPSRDTAPRSGSSMSPQPAFNAASKRTGNRNQKGGHDGVPHRSLRDLLTPSTPAPIRRKKVLNMRTSDFSVPRVCETDQMSSKQDVQRVVSNHNPVTVVSKRRLETSTPTSCHNRQTPDIEGAHSEFGTIDALGYNNGKNSASSIQNPSISGSHGNLDESLNDTRSRSNGRHTERAVPTPSERLASTTIKLNNVKRKKLFSSVNAYKRTLSYPCLGKNMRETQAQMYRSEPQADILKQDVNHTVEASLDMLVTPKPPKLEQESFSSIQCLRDECATIVETSLILSSKDSLCKPMQTYTNTGPWSAESFDFFGLPN